MHYNEGQIRDCYYWVEYKDEPGGEGRLDGGRITKLTIIIGNEMVCQFDATWKIRPNRKYRRLMEVFRELKQIYN